MAKHRGINTRVLIDGYDFSNYFKTFQGDAMVNALDATGFLATNKEYLVDGFQDGKVSLEGFYARDQETPDQVDNILRSALGSATKKVVTIAPVNSDTLGNYCFLVSADQSKLTVKDQHSNLIMEMVDFLSSSGLESGVILQPVAALTATGNGTAVDNAAATNNGGAGHLHVTAASGTTPTLNGKIQHSVDGSTWVDLITFAQKTTVGAERIETAGLSVAQVETATVGGAATASANVIVTVTGAGIAGSPLATNVAVANLDSAATIGGLIRAALNGVSAITALYTVGGSGANYTLTRIVPAANDATLNIALDGATNSTGVPDAASSANTTAGVAARSIYRYLRFIRTIGGTTPSFTATVAFARH